MSDFGVQLILWLVAAVSGSFAVVHYARMLWDHQGTWGGVLTELGKRKQELASLNEQIKDADERKAQRDQAVTEEAEKRKWLADQKEQLLQVEGERQRQETLRQELAAIQEKLGLEQAEFQRLTTENARLTAANDDLTKANVEAEEEAEALARRKSKLEENLQVLESTAKETTAEINRMITEQNRLSETLAAQQKQLGELTQAVALAERRLGDVKAESDREARQLTSAQETLKQVRDQIRSLETQQQALEAQVAIWQQRAQAAQATSEQWDKKVQAFEAQALDLKKQIADGEAKLAGLRSEKQALEANIAALKGIAQRLSDELSQAGTGPRADRYRDLWQPLPFAALLPPRHAPDEEAAVRQTSLYLQSQRLVFPERVLHAFHTALKVNAISPLTVLAGISGTGKSELPQRYAEGMGLHFVMLAVQPRWDSPQDLFGFYNYLEKRYKATDLARAMVQFERHNRQFWPKNVNENSRDDRMLLVLLDEMNLARVEYYFSEFLSKLEKRRGLDTADPNERAVAEIALEMGSLNEGEQPIRLYPDQNVLFVGTMNEDESTQSLSDKVLDRACVLRFGRPRQTTTVTPGALTNASENGMTFETWTKWLRQPQAGSSDSQKVGQWIHTLNDAMEAMGRPFGYRVAQAIQSYAANYPKWVARPLELAMADQIEQRILPKVRGVDVEENRSALDKIQQVISDLGDGPLSEAFSHGRKSSAGFLWRGIDRSETI